MPLVSVLASLHWIQATDANFTGNYAYCLSSLYLLCIFYIQVQNTANTYTKYCCILKSSKFACIQMNNPFTAGFPHTGLPGGYSVELVCQTLIITQVYTRFQISTIIYYIWL